MDHPTAHGRGGWAVEQAIAGGARWVLLRDKTATSSRRRAMMCRMTSITTSTGVVISAHDDPGLAAESRVKGLHFSQAGFTSGLRPCASWQGWWGVSVHDDAELCAARQAGAHYAMVSPVFHPISKPLYRTALGLVGLTRLAGLTEIGVVALGGIDVNSAKACLMAGASAVAVMGVVMGSVDPRSSTAQLLTSLR